MKRSMMYRLGLICGVAGSVSLAVAQPRDRGASLEFDGVDDVVVSYADFHTEELTLETWVRVDATDPVYASGLISWSTRDQGSYEFCVGPPSDRTLCFFINYNNGTQQTAHGQTLLELGEWYYVAATYDGETARLYVDGVLDAEVELGDPMQPVGEGARLTIGDNWAGASEFVRGAFDEVMVWSTVRTESQIQGDMGGGNEYAQDAPMMAYYTFDELRSNVVLDHSGEGRHAHLGASYDIGPDDAVAHRWDDGLGRTRVMQITSHMLGDVEAIGGSQETQLLCVNNCATQSNWLPIVNRHEDHHVRSSFYCTDLLDEPYVDTETFLTGADEVTFHNCESAFYRFNFYLPPVFDGGDFYGVLNADDMGVVHLNGEAVSPTILQWDVDNFGTQRVDPFGHPVIGWPTADPAYALGTVALRPGVNELIVAVASDISEFEPAGMEFVFNIRYDCLADWNGDGENNSLDFLVFLNDWSDREGSTDVNLDGTIDTLDVLLWMNTWSFGCPE
jgi:hypothetical protein